MNKILFVIAIINILITLYILVNMTLIKQDTSYLVEVLEVLEFVEE
jgi:hypothetical protein